MVFSTDGTFATFVPSYHMPLQGLGFDKRAHTPGAGVTAANHLKSALFRCLFCMHCNKMNAQAPLIGKGPFTRVASYFSGIAERLLHAPSLSVGANVQKLS